MPYTFPEFPPNPDNKRIYPKIVVNKRWQGNIPESYFLGEWPDIYIDFDEVAAWMINEEVSHDVKEVPLNSNWGTRINMYWGHTAGETRSPGAWCVAFVNWAYLHFFKNHWGVKSPWVSGSTTITWFKTGAEEGFLRYYPEDVKAGIFKVRAGDCILWAHANPWVLNEETFVKTWNSEIAAQNIRDMRATKIYVERYRGKMPDGSRIGDGRVSGCRHISLMTGKRWDNEFPTPGEVENPNGEWLEEIQGNTDEIGNARDGGLVRKKRKSLNRPDIMGFIRFHGRANICTTTACLAQNRRRVVEPIAQGEAIPPAVVFSPVLSATAGNSIVFTLGVIDSSGISEGILYWRKAGQTTWQQKNIYSQVNGKIIFTLANSAINPGNDVYTGNIDYYFSFKDNSPRRNTKVMPSFPLTSTYYTLTVN